MYYLMKSKHAIFSNFKVTNVFNVNSKNIMLFLFKVVAVRRLKTV